MKQKSLNHCSGAALSVLVLLVLVSIATYAQPPSSPSNNNPSRGGGTGVSHTLRGKLYLPSGNIPEQRIRVVLELSAGGIVSEAFSDSVGNFEFRGLSNSSYKITVPSDQQYFETTQEQVEVYGSFARTFTVQIYLRDKNSETTIITKDKILSPADIQEVPKPAKKAYEQGVKLARNNKTSEASVKLQEALAIFPDYLYALNKIGEQFIALNKADEAKAAFERAITVNKKFALPHINLGILYFTQRQYDKAIAELENANSLDDSYPMGHLHLGLALMSKPEPDFERAEKELTRTLEIGRRDFVNVRKYLFNLNVRRQAYKKAAEQLEAYLREVPEASDSQDVRLMLDKVKKEAARQAALQKQK